MKRPAETAGRERERGARGGRGGGEEEEETRTPTMTRRKPSMKSFISGISVDDTLSSFLHGFKAPLFYLSLSLSLSSFLPFPA